MTSGKLKPVASKSYETLTQVWYHPPRSVVIFFSQQRITSVWSIIDFPISNNSIRQRWSPGTEPKLISVFLVSLVSRKFDFFGTIMIIDRDEIVSAPAFRKFLAESESLSIWKAKTGIFVPTQRPPGPSSFYSYCKKTFLRYICIEADLHIWEWNDNEILRHVMATFARTTRRLYIHIYIGTFYEPRCEVTKSVAFFSTREFFSFSNNF